MKKHCKGLGHIAIYTKDIGQSIAFYEKIGGKLHKSETLSVPEGEKRLALVEFAGILLEFIQPPITETWEEGVISHFAVYVDDVDAAAEELKTVGVDTFIGMEKKVLPHLFGGLENRFFTGPSGEKIELLKML